MSTMSGHGPVLLPRARFVGVRYAVPAASSSKLIGCIPFGHHRFHYALFGIAWHHTA